MSAVRTLAPVATMAMGEQQATGALVVAPQNFSEVLSFADRMAESRFVPAHMRGKPADCLAVCMQALRWAMDPFMVAQKTYFTKEGEPPGYEAQLVNAVVYARAPLEGRLDIQWDGKWPNRICIVTGRIRHDPNPKVRTVNAAGIQTRNSPLWKTDPDQQLAYYATRAWARLFCPDVLMGVYTPDEIREGHDRADVAQDITPAAERPASRLDALEQIVEAETMEAGGEPAHDPQTGEIIEPAAEPERDEFGLPPAGAPTATDRGEPDYETLATNLWADALDIGEYARLREWFTGSPSVADLKRATPELYADLLGKINARLKALKK